MEKENWFERMYTKKRFWGSVAITVGGLLQIIPIPVLVPIGVYLAKAGAILLSAGLIDKADSMKKEKKAAEEQGSSDQ